jgi:hypothetical protein
MRAGFACCLTPSQQKVRGLLKERAFVLVQIRDALGRKSQTTLVYIVALNRIRYITPYYGEGYTQRIAI